MFIKESFYILNIHQHTIFDINLKFQKPIEN